MPAVRVGWEAIVRLWKRWRPARRRRRWGGSMGEAFEPRRMLSAFVVNSMADSHDANPGDGFALDANGDTTLRAAIEETNALPGADTIQLPAGRFMFGQGSRSSFIISDDLQIIGAGSGRSVIDGSAWDQVFQRIGSGQLQLSGVDVVTSHDLAASLRPALLTTNARQIDLIVSFSATPTLPRDLVAPTSTGRSELFSAELPESDVDFSPTLEALDIAQADLSVYKITDDGRPMFPRPDATIDEIINALFRDEPLDLVLPVSGETPETPMVEDRSELVLPMSDSDQKQDRPDADKSPKLDSESPSDGMSMSQSDSDDEQTSATPVTDEAVQAVLRGWADDAGWPPFAVWTSGSRTSAVSNMTARRPMAAMATLVLSGVVSQTWTWTSGQHWLRESVSPVAWRQRFKRLRRRAR